MGWHFFFLIFILDSIRFFFWREFILAQLARADRSGFLRCSADKQNPNHRIESSHNLVVSFHLSAAVCPFIAMEVPSLTRGAAQTLTEEISSESVFVVVQVVRIIKLPASSDVVNRTTRYRLVLSDGENLVQGLAAAQMNHLIETRMLAEHDVIRVKDYMANLIQSRTVVILLDVDVIVRYGRIIGNPNGLDANSAGVGGGEGSNVSEGNDGAAGAISGLPSPRASKRGAGEMMPGGRESVVAASDDPQLRTLGAAISEEVKCPISHELLVDPVTAEDGFQYERESIQKYFEHVGSSGTNRILRSPKTNLPMGDKLTDAIVVRNITRHMVQSGALGSDIADRYQRQNQVASLKKRAGEKDIGAMRLLATWYKTGMHGLEPCPRQAEYWKDKAAACDLELCALRNNDSEAMCMLGKGYGAGIFSFLESRKDAKTAFRWFSMAAERMDSHGMAYAGNAIAEGNGTTKHEAKGITLVAAAAAMQSDCGCFFFGRYYFEGKHGLRLDWPWAKYWLKKAVDLSAKEGGFLDTEQIENAKEMLRNIRA